MDPSLGLRRSGFQLLPRQSSEGGTCSAGSVAEEAKCILESNDCPGALYPESPCNAGYECCLISTCNNPGGSDVPAGSGYCKNDTRDVCDGEWYTGNVQDPPCRGDNNIRCCINWATMDNGTTSGLTGPQIGGTVGGVVGFVVLAVAGLLLWYFLYWKKKKLGGQQQQQQTDRDSREPMFPGGAGSGHGYVPVSELHGQGTAVAMHQIDGKERMELDGHGQAILEMDANSGPVELDASETGTVRNR